MNPIEIIIKKRDKHELTRDEINFMVDGYTKSKIPDYQFSSFLMAIYANGMSIRETADLSFAMIYSGKTLDLESAGYTIDKHSTGGVGDKITLIVIPLAASAGLTVPTMFGRALGHTGGTHDKLESIKGFKMFLTEKQIIKQLQKIGAVMIGTSGDCAPADKKIYALRDVTGTVESIPLIAASIISKKFAEGTDALLMDVKTGNGAFMKSHKDARLLAKTIVSISKVMGKKTVALITDMNQPLGHTVGNALEVKEALDTLQCKGPDDVTKLSLTITAHMLLLGKKAHTFTEAYTVAETHLRNGCAYRKFIEIVKSQGGNVKQIAHPYSFKKPRYIKKCKSISKGYITNINTYEIGMIANILGAGRLKLTDKIDSSAGIVFHKKIGDSVKKGDTLCEIHTDKKECIIEALERISFSIQIEKKKPHAQKLILGIAK
ncbi:MAG: thymidine phosphorylase [Candidatus Ancaeobacter aquaticus]|nr:thymidine phosphorylase [Candidatus Ancaeobacter aquaticus]